MRGIRIGLVLIIFGSVLQIASCEQRRISKLSTVSGKNKTRVTRADAEPGEKYRALSTKMKYEAFELPEHYNKLQIPSLAYVVAYMKGLPSSEFEIFDLISMHNIVVTLRFQDISDMSEIDEDITFAADLILQWTDEVIKWHGMERFNVSSEEAPENTNPLFKTLDQEFLLQIWKPDIFIESLVKVSHPDIMTKPVTVRLNEVTGEIIYVSRLRIHMECEMDFHFYPADTQTCSVQLRSHSYSVDEMHLSWAKPFGAYLEDCGGPNYDFKVDNVEEGEIEEGYIGNTTRKFSGLKLNIMARRKMSYHIVQTFIPSVFFIVITWLCFLVPPSMVEARIGITMTTLLTLTAMFAAVRESTPSVSYVRAIDVWMLSCIFFVFLTLLEFSVLIWLRSPDSEKEDKPEREKEEASVEFLPKPTGQGGKGQGSRQEGTRKARASKIIERFAFITFSVLFLIFNAMYWSWLLIGSDYFGWTVDYDYNRCRH